MAERLDTFPAPAAAPRAGARPTIPRSREKDLGIWQTWTWSQVADEVRALACGLAAQGFKRGMHLAIVGDNRPRLYWAMPPRSASAAFRCRCTRTRRPRRWSSTCSTTPRSRSRSSRTRSRSTSCSRSRPQVPDARAHLLRRPARPAQLRAARSTSFDEPAGDRPRVRSRAIPDFFDAEVAKGQPRTTCRSCSTPRAPPASRRACVPDPRGVHRRRRRRRRVRQASRPTRSVLSYLPMAWVGRSSVLVRAVATSSGFTINCPESGDTVMTDMREIGPTYYFAPPRVFENLLTQVMIRMEDAGALKRGLFRYFMGVARRVGAEILDAKEPVGARRPAALRASATCSSTGRCATCSA